MENSNAPSPDKFELYNVILDYIQNGMYPPGYSKDDKRKIRSKATRFRISSCGKLMYEKNGAEAKQVVMSANEARKILFDFHDLRGHLGRDKTAHTIDETYFWDGMFGDIDKYVKSCEKCQLVNYTHFDKRNHELHPIPIKSPWFHIGMDLIMLPESAKGNKYVFTMCDYFTKWPEAVALPDKSAESVSLALYKVCLRMGFPSIYSSDQGREFVNKIMDVLKNISKSEQRISTAYHPQTNGLVERFNQTLQRMLLKCCKSEKQDDWDDYIDECLYSYRTTIQASTKITPFEGMFGRKAVAITMNNANEKQDNCAADEDCEQMTETNLKELQEHREKLFTIIKENVHLAQVKQRKQYNTKIKKGKDTLNEGDNVLVYNSKKASRKGSKLEKTWTGPYTVAEKLQKNVYRLKSTEGTVLKKKYNGALLKKYNKREELLPLEKSTVSGKTETRKPLRKGCTKSNDNFSHEVPDDFRVTCGFEPPKVSRQFVVPSEEELARLAQKIHVPEQPFQHTETPKTTVLGPPKKVIHIKGDGNCFFRSISYVLYGTESYYHQVRQSVVHHMTDEAHKSNFENYLNINNIQEYLEKQKIMCDGTWATDVEIMAVASMLQTDIEIYTTIGNEENWLRYPASFKHNKYTSSALYLVNEGGVHFNVVASV